MKKISRFLSFVMVCALMITSTGVESLVYASEIAVSNMINEETAELGEDQTADIEDATDGTAKENEEVSEAEEDSKADVEEATDESDKANEESKVDAEDTSVESDKTNEDSKGDVEDATNKVEENSTVDVEDTSVESDTIMKPDTEVELDNQNQSDDMKEKTEDKEEIPLQKEKNKDEIQNDEVENKEGLTKNDRNQSSLSVFASLAPSIIRDEFNIQSYVSKSDGTLADIGDTLYINGNSINMTDWHNSATYGYNYQTTILTRKKAVDFSRPFTVKGSLYLGQKREQYKVAGVAIAFHNDGVNYKLDTSKGIHASSFGLYNGAGSSTGLRKGNALVAEIDAYQNNGSESGTAVGDSAGSGAGVEGVHTAIATVRNGGNADKNDTEHFRRTSDNYYLYSENGSPYEVSWQLDSAGADSGTLTIKYTAPDGYVFTSNKWLRVSDYFDNWHRVYMSIGTGSGIDNHTSTATPAVVKMSYDGFRYTDYPQAIQVFGIGVGPSSDIDAVDNLYYDKFYITVQPTSTNTYRLIGSVAPHYWPSNSNDNFVHSGFPGQRYVEIKVYPKGSKLGDPGTVLFTCNGDDWIKKLNFSTLNSYDFQEGDIIKINHLESKFWFQGEKLIDNDNNKTLDYNGLWKVGREKGQNSVYEITKDGFKEIYNAAPVLKGDTDLIFIKNGAHDLDTILKKGFIATDDRNANGIYAPNTSYTDKIIVSDVPQTIVPNKSTVTYSVTDSWGRETTVKRKVIVLPNLDFVDIEGVTDNGDGTISFPENTIIDEESDTITLPNGVVIDVTNKTVSVPTTNNQTQTKIQDNGTVVLPDTEQVIANGKVTVSEDKTVTIPTKDGNVVVKPDGTVVYPMTYTLDYIRIYDHGLTDSKTGMKGYDDASESYDLSKAVNDRDISRFLQPGLHVDVKLRFRNPVYISTDIQEQLHLEELQFMDQQIKVIPGTIRYQDTQHPEWDTIQHEQQIFDKDHPLTVYYPKNSGMYSLYFHIEIPEIDSFDITKMENQELPYLSLSVSAGMSQKVLSKKVAYASKPIIESQWITFNSIITKSFSQVYSVENFAHSKLVQAKTYDDQEYHPLSDIENYGMKLNSENYYYFDDNTDQLEAIPYQDFDNHSKTSEGETGFYVYSYSVQDTRTIPLVNSKLIVSGAACVFMSDDKNTAYKLEDNTNYFLLSNASSIDISETKMAKDLMDPNKFENYLIDQLSLKAYKGTGIDYSKADYSLEYDAALLKNPIPGTYDLKVKVTGTTVEKTIQLKITPNTWSYNTDKRTEENGASGFIVIPKIIELKSTSQGNEISDTEEIFFANYRKATSVRYDVSVDKTFALIKTDNPSSKIMVTSSADSAKDIGENKLYIGEMNYRYVEGFGYEVNFSAPNDEASRYKGRWTGNVTFYFERK